MSSSTEDLEIDFYGWSKQSLEGGLDAMGCQGSSESTSSLLSGSKLYDTHGSSAHKRLYEIYAGITATLLNSDESKLQQAQYKYLKSLESTKYQVRSDSVSQSESHDQVYNPCLHGTLRLN